MSALPLLAVFCGAGFGAVLRWLFALWLNPLWPAMPLGTLAANLLGGLLVGLASSVFSQQGAVPLELRLLVITGFLGGLTTFSTFSAEVVGMLVRQQALWALATAGAHLAGSLLLTGAGLWLGQALWQARG